MPARLRHYSREARKKQVLLVVRGAMTIRQVAAAVGWPVAVTNSVVTALAVEGRLLEAGSALTFYGPSRNVRKEVKLYKRPPQLDPMAMPAWLMFPPKVPDYEEPEES